MNIKENILNVLRVGKLSSPKSTREMSRDELSERRDAILNKIERGKYDGRDLIERKDNQRELNTREYAESAKELELKDLIHEIKGATRIIDRQLDQGFSIHNREDAFYGSPVYLGREGRVRELQDRVLAGEARLQILLDLGYYNLFTPEEMELIKERELALENQIPTESQEMTEKELDVETEIDKEEK